MSMKNSNDTIGNIAVSKKKKVKWSRYRLGVLQRVGRGIAVLFHDRGTRRGWVVSSTPRQHFTPGKVPVPIVQEAGWAPGPVWTGGKSLPHRDSIPDRPSRSSVAIPTELPGPHIVVSTEIVRIHTHTGLIPTDCGALCPYLIVRLYSHISLKTHMFLKHSCRYFCSMSPN